MSKRSEARIRLIKQMGFVTDISYREALGTAISAIDKIEYLEERIKMLEIRCKKAEQICDRNCVGCDRAYVCREEVLKLVKEI